LLLRRGGLARHPRRLHQRWRRDRILLALQCAALLPAVGAHSGVSNRVEFFLRGRLADDAERAAVGLGPNSWHRGCGGIVALAAAPRFRALCAGSTATGWRQTALNRRSPKEWERACRQIESQSPGAAPSSWQSICPACRQ